VAAFIKPLEEEKDRLKKLLATYQVEVERAAREEARKQEAELQRLEQERAALESAPQTAETALKVKQVEAQMGQNLQVNEAPRAQGVTTRPVRKFRVVDLNKLYAVRPDLVKLEASTAAINAVIRAPGNEKMVIDGLDIFEEMEVVAR
jgi:hypothetical protein